MVLIDSRAVWHVFKNLGFLGFLKNLKNLKSPNLGFYVFKKNKKPNVRFKFLSFISLIMQLI